jgi:hypothetical protein
MLIFQPPVNFCSDKNIQTIFGTKLEDFLNYRIDYNLISQTVEKIVVKAALRSRQDNLEVVKGFRSQGVHNILCATRKFVIIK